MPLLHTATQLHEALEAIKGVPVLVVGDLILDRYIWGKVERISPEAPVPVVEVTRDEDRLGGAGNVVRNLTQLGAAVAVCGFVGDDDEGGTVLSLLGREGLSRDGILIDRGRPTILKTRVIAYSQQIVRIDREKKGHRELPLREGFAAVVEAHLEESKAVILSDYGKGTISKELCSRLTRCYESGALGLSTRPLIVDPHPQNYGIYPRMTMAKPNRKEAEAAVGFPITDNDAAFRAARLLKERWQSELMMVTLGEGGLAIVGPREEDATLLPTHAVEVFDVSGAGDTVTAVFTAAVAAGASPGLAGELANIAAGVVVSEVGTVAISKETLTDAIDKASQL